jgi:PTH1 family peptidyl-tRNA hydrolase
MTPGWLLVGLGNPGSDYVHNRHNVGFQFLDWFTEHSALERLSAVFGPIKLLKPDQFMNLSGFPVQKSLAYYKIPRQRLLVVHDDADLEFGEVRLKRYGGDAGHKGIRSVVEQLGDDRFNRIRIGIGRPDHERISLERYVLDDFTTAEAAELPAVFERALAVITEVLEESQ